MLGALRVGETLGESSWRGRAIASCGHQPRHSCLRVTMCPQASEVGSALRMQEKTQEKRDGRNGQRECERQETAMEPCMG
jgi:hypothetical protein